MKVTYIFVLNVTGMYLYHNIIIKVSLKTKDMSESVTTDIVTD